MNIGTIRERGAFDRRVALTPAVVRRLASAGHTVWVETGAGDGAMYSDPEYLRAGAQIAYSPEEAIGRAELLAKIGRPTSAELNWCAPGMVLSATELLRKNQKPSRGEIQEAIAGNLCRCTGYTPIIEAIEDAAKK